MRKNLHPGCSCFMCRMGQGRERGKIERKKANRRLRRKTKAAIKKGGDEVVIVSISYTD